MTDKDDVVTMNVSLRADLFAFVVEVSSSFYGSRSEYVRELIRRDRERRVRFGLSLPDLPA